MTIPKTNRKIQIFLLFLLITTFSVTACQKDENSGQIPETPQPTATIIPTLAPDRIVLVAAPDGNSTNLAEAQTLIPELASSAGLAFETRPELFENEITPDMKIVVFLKQPDNLGSLSTTSPDTQFVAISDQVWNPTPNTTIIQLREDHTAFLAGYISAMLAPNFRVGAMLVSEETSQNQSFRNGVNYYCGMCAAKVFPLNTYPFIAELPANTPAANWQTSFNEINANTINVLYLDDDVVSTELSNFLAAQEIALVGNQEPIAEAQSRWTVTIIPDPIKPIYEIWPDLISGQGGNIVTADLKINNYNYISLQDGLVWMSEGKLKLVNEVIGLLREGQIYTSPILN